MNYEPKLKVVETDFPANRSVRVDQVLLSNNGLEIQMTSSNWTAIAHFESSWGFRVLDEGDLCEFWSQGTLKDGWCFEVLTGGWNDLENTRDHYLTGKLYKPREFLIISIDECVSVLADNQPSVSGA